MQKGSTRSNILTGLAVAIVVFALSWVILFFFAPVFVRYQVTDTGEDDHSKADPARCLVYSLLIVVIVLLVLDLFRTCVGSFSGA